MKDSEKFKEIGKSVVFVISLLICWEVGEYLIGKLSPQLKVPDGDLAIIETILIGCSTGLLALVGFLIALLTLNSQNILGRCRDILLRLADLTSPDKTFKNENAEKIETAVSDYKLIIGSVGRSSLVRYKYYVKQILWFVAIVWYVAVLLLSANSYNWYVMILKISVALLIFGFVQYLEVFKRSAEIGENGDLPSFENLVDGSIVKNEVRTVDLAAASIKGYFRRDATDQEKYRVTISPISEIKNVSATVRCIYYKGFWEKIGQDESDTEMKWLNPEQKGKEFMHQFQLMPDCDNLHVEIRIASSEGEAFTEISLQAADLRKQPAVSLGSIFGFNIPMDIRVSFEKGPE